MEVTTERFIRKPLYVDAVRVKADNFDEIVAWCQGEVLTDEVPGTGTTKKYIKVRVHNPKNPRQTKAFIGDWLLYTERGYKVYTNKAFRQAFDLVNAEGVAEPQEQESGPKEKPQTMPVDQVDLGRIPKFYIDPGSGELTETSPHHGAQPLSLTELMNIVRNELVGGELDSVQPEEAPTLYKTLSEPIQEVRPGADLGTTPQGEKIEVVEATPQAIADTVHEQQPERCEHNRSLLEACPACDRVESVKPQEEETSVTSPSASVELDEEDATGKIEQAGQPEPVSEQPPEDAAAGKRVLSEEEQRQMGPDAVREMVRSGDVVLVQDLAA